MRFAQLVGDLLEFLIRQPVAGAFVQLVVHARQQRIGIPKGVVHRLGDRVEQLDRRDEPGDLDVVHRHGVKGPRDVARTGDHRRVRCGLRLLAELGVSAGVKDVPDHADDHEPAKQRQHQHRATAL